MDAEGRGGLRRKGAEGMSVFGESFRAAFDSAQRAAVSAEGLRLYGPGLNKTGILTSLKWDRPCKIACLEIYRFCIFSLVPRAAIAVIDNVITGKVVLLN